MAPTMRIARRVSVAAFVAILIVCSPGFAQLAGGRIVGSVKDPSGAAVPEASVVARHAATGVETTVATSDAGAYSIGSLQVGTYSVTVTKSGFQTSTREGVPVILGQAVTADFDLAVGSLAQVVAVSGGVQTLDTTSTTVGTTRTLQELQDLPLQVSGTARTPLDFLQTLAGVNGSVIEGAGEGNFRQVQSLKIDGLLSSIDGTQAFAFEHFGVVPDTIEEFRVVTNPNAESGWDLGSSVQFITKSGTNRFHGSAFEYLRNNALDSRNFLAQKVDPLHQNEYGATIGGPIIKDKLFFFGFWGGFRLRVAPSSALLSLPTAKMRTGDFSELLGAQVGTDALSRPVYTGEIYDYSTTRTLPAGTYVRDPYNYNGQLNVIPPGQLSSISKYFQQGYPATTLPGTVQNYVGNSIPNNSNEQRFSGKVDYTHGAQRLSGGYDAVPTFANPFGCSPLFNADTAFEFGPEIRTCTEFTIQWHRARLNYTATLRPDLLFNLSAGYTGRVAQILSNVDEANGLHGGAAAGLRGTYSDRIPKVNIGGGCLIAICVGIAETQGFGSHIGSIRGLSRIWPINADLSWVRGRHDFKFGAQYLLTGRPSVGDADCGSGCFTFSPQETGLPGFAQTGWGYASFLLGEVDSGRMSTASSVKKTSTAWGLYAQDQWRVTSKLTINYGLRWDIFLTPHETYDRMSFFDPTIPNPAAGGRLGALTFFGVGPGRNGRHNILDTWYRAFGPRLGISYALNSKTVVRASYGVLYYPMDGTDYYGGGALFSGWGATLTPASVNSGITSAFNWNNGWPGPLPILPNLNPSLVNGSSVPYNNPIDNKAGMSQNIGLSVERTFPGQLSIRADYVGKLQHNLPSSGTVSLNQIDPKYLSLGSLLQSDINSPQAQAAGIAVPYAGFTGTVAQALRPFPQYDNINQLDAKDGNLLYHALELNVQKRVHQGLTFLVAYTWSKTLTNDQQACLACTPTPPVMQFTQFRGNYKAVLYSSRPHTLKLSYSYDLPFGPGKPYLSSSKPVLRQVVGGWKVAGIHVYQQATPVNITTNQQIPTVAPVWANRVPGIPIRTNVGCGSYDPKDPDASKTLYLNPNAFTAPAPFTVGNTNTLPDVRGCASFNESISLLKTFPIRENIRLELGADAFNVFNRHIWGSLNSNINSAAFGKLSSASSPRTMQLHLRVEF